MLKISGGHTKLVAGATVISNILIFYRSKIDKGGVSVTRGRSRIAHLNNLDWNLNGTLFAVNLASRQAQAWLESRGWGRYTAA